jgi:hypothetical protein
MTNTKIYYLRGTAMWAKLKELDKKFKVHTMDLYPDDESLELFKSANTELKLRDGKLNDEDRTYIKLRRDPIRVIAGEAVDIGPVKVFIQKDGEVTPFEELVGNGSKVVVKISVYPTPKGNGHRLESVLIEELVPYAKAEVMNEEEFPF